MMKPKPVRISDVSRILRIPSTSLISFLHNNGYSVKGDFRSPLTGRMVELIQTGYREGAPFDELNPYIPRAEEWEKQNSDLVHQLHKPPPEPQPEVISPPQPKIRKKRKSKPKPRIISAPDITHNSGRITVTYLDMEIIQRIFDLGESDKIRVRDHLRRKTLLKAIAKLS